MDENQKYVLDKTLSRVDFYLNVINVKAAFLVAFDTFILGTILLKYSDIIDQFVFYKVKSLVVFLIIMMTLGIVGSLFKIFGAVAPFLKSGNKPDAYCSILYFGSVAGLTIEEYEEKVKCLNENILINDLIQQNHLLSKSLEEKFNKINAGINAIIWLTILPMTIIVILKIIEWFFA